MILVTGRPLVTEMNLSYREALSYRYDLSYTEALSYRDDP